MNSRRMLVISVLSIFEGVLANFNAGAAMTQQGQVAYGSERQMTMNMMNQGAGKPNDLEGQKVDAKDLPPECLRNAYRTSGNTMIEGVTINPINEYNRTEYAREKAQECMKRKAEHMNKLKQKMQELIMKEPMKPEGKQCIKRLNREQKECFAKKVLQGFYTKPVWHVVVHDNVAQLWYKDKLVFMVAAESFKYNFTKHRQPCLTFFPSANLSAKSNALGNLVSVVGKPVTAQGKAKCRPCSELMNKGTTDGSGADCSDTCDPYESLFTSSQNNVVFEKESKEKEDDGEKSKKSTSE